MATKIVDLNALDSALSAFEGYVMRKSSDLPLIFHGTIATKPATVSNASAVASAEILYCTTDHRFYARNGSSYYNNWPGRDLYQHLATGNAYSKLYYKSTTNGYELYTIDSAGGLVKIPADYYNKSEMDTKLAAKANTSTTYTKTEVDTKLAAKANTSTTYTKTEVDTKLAAKANTADVYTKTTADSTFMKTANYPVMTEAEAIALVNELFA